MTSYGMSISHINVELKNWLKYGGGDGHQDVGDDAGTFYVLISCIYAFLWYVYLTYDSWWFYHNVCGVCVGGGQCEELLDNGEKCGKPAVGSLEYPAYGLTMRLCQNHMDLVEGYEDDNTLNIKGNRLCVVAEYDNNKASTFKIPDGLDLNDKSVVVLWYVKRDTLYINYKDGRKKEIHPHSSGCGGDVHKIPSEVTIEFAEDFVEYSDDDDAGTFYVLLSYIYAFLLYVYLTYESW